MRCTVPDSGASLRVSYGILNLAHRDGHETPAPLVPGQRLSGSHAAQRCWCCVSGRTQDQAGDLHQLLANDMAAAGARQLSTVFDGTLELPVRRCAPKKTTSLLPLPGPRNRCTGADHQELGQGVVRTDRSLSSNWEA